MTHTVYNVLYMCKLPLVVLVVVRLLHHLKDPEDGGKEGEKEGERKWEGNQKERRPREK